MMSVWIGRVFRVVLNVLVTVLSRCRIHPNTLTLLGMAINVIAAFYLSFGGFYTAGWIIFAAGAMDILDGAVARKTHTATEFGAFFDSVIDRYSDIALYLGLIVYYGHRSRMDYVDLVGVCIMGSLMTSYARARAECLIEGCKVGFLERPERVVLMILGAWFNRMEHVLWVIAVLSNWTVISRILYTYFEMPRSQFFITVHSKHDKPGG